MHIGQNVEWLTLLTTVNRVLGENGGIVVATDACDGGTAGTAGGTVDGGTVDGGTGQAHLVVGFPVVGSLLAVVRHGDAVVDFPRRNSSMKRIAQISTSAQTISGITISIVTNPSSPLVEMEVFRPSVFSVPSIM